MPLPLTLRRRWQLLLAVIAVLFAGNLFVDIAVVRARDRAVDLTEDRLQPAREALSELQTALVDQETSSRGYVIAGDGEFLEAFADGGRRVEAGLATLRELLDHDADLMAGVERVAARVSAWQDLGAQVEITAKREGRDAEAVRLVRAGTAKELFDATRAESAALRTVLIGRLDAAQDHLTDLRRGLTLALLTSSLLGLGALALGAVLLRVGVDRPLQELLAAVSSVAGGELGRPIPAPAPREFAELGTAIEGMRLRILAELDDATRAREALAKRGLIVLSMRDELSPAEVSFAGARLAVRFRPVEGIVAGDCCLALPLHDDRLAAALLDVSGHGAEAAVFALRTKELTTAALTMGLDPGDVFNWVAERLGDTEDRLVTGVAVILDTKTGELHYANAGHPPLLLAGGGDVTVLNPTGPLVGISSGRWETETLVLGPGHYVAAYSDGIIEARSEDGTEFGVEGLASLLAAAPAGDLEAVAEACLEAVDAHRVGGQRDDMTLFLLACDPAPAESGEEPSPGESQVEAVI